MLLYVLLGKVAVIVAVVSDYVPYLLGYGILRGVKAGYGGKDSDRISAAKLLLEYGEGESDDALTVIMEGAAGEYGK